jgi:hypothetical protein
VFEPLKSTGLARPLLSGVELRGGRPATSSIKEVTGRCGEVVRVRDEYVCRGEFGVDWAPGLVRGDGRSKSFRISRRSSSSADSSDIDGCDGR